MKTTLILLSLLVPSCAGLSDRLTVYAISKRLNIKVDYSPQTAPGGKEVMLEGPEPQ